MKKLGYALLGLLGALLLALLVAPSFIDWNSYTRRLAQEFQARTGHELDIAGELELSMLPAPTLVAREVTLHKPGEDGLTHLASLGGLRARLAFWPLLAGELHLQSIRLSQPKIDIVADAAGNTNWDDLLDRLGLRAEMSGSRGFGLVRFEDMRLEGAEITLQRGGKTFRLADLDAQLSARSLKGPLRAEGSFNSKADETNKGRKTFGMRMGRLADDGTATLALTLDFQTPDEGAESFGLLELDGRLAVKAWRFAGNLRWRGEGLVSDLQRFAGLALPDLLPGPYEIAGKAELDPNRLVSSALTLKTGSSSFSGRADLAFGAPPRLDLELSTGQLDLDALLAAAKERGESDSDPEEKPADLPALLGQVNLGADVVIYRGQILRQLRLSADLLSDRAEVAQFYAILPGSTSLEMAGTWWPQGSAELWDLEGRFDLRSGNLRALLGWLEIATDSVPANRLRRLTAGGFFKLKSGKVELTAVDLSLDQTKAKAAASLNLGERFGLGLRLDLDRLDLDAYRLTSEPSDDAAGDNWLDLLSQALSIDPPLLGFMDVNLDLAAGKLIQGERAFGDLVVKTTLLAGQFNLLEARIGTLPEGGSLRASGQLGPAEPLTFSVDYTATLLNPRLFAFRDAFATFGNDSGPLDVSGQAEITAEEIALENRISLQDGVLDLKGRVDISDPGRPFTFSLGYRQDEAANFYARVFDPALSDEDLGKIALAASARGDVAILKLADIEGFLGPLNLSGSLNFERAEEKLIPTDGGLDLLFAHDDAESLFKILLPGVTKKSRLLKDDFGPVTLRATVGLEEGTWRLGNLGGEIGAVPIKGEAWLNLKRDRPMLALNLSAGRIDWAAIEEPAPADEGAQGPSRWRAFLAALRPLDGDFRIGVEEMNFGRWNLEDVVFESQLLSNLLDLKKLEATLSDGQLALAGKLDLGGRQDFDLSATLQEVDPAPFLEEDESAFGGQGRIDLAARLSGSARSTQAFKRSLSGTTTLEGKLDLHQAEGPEIARYLEMRLDPWLARQDGLSERLGHAIGLVAGGPGDLSADLKVTDGILAISRLSYRREEQSLAITGEANLPARYMNVMMALEGEEEGSLRLRGDFDAPAITARGF